VSPDLEGATLTLLFSDVEGSTRLLKQLRAERYGEALAEHRRILRAAFAEHDGQEIDTQGDAFFVAFRRASDAALAAAAAQRALADHPWPPGAAFRVRMGLHTGEPSVGDEGLHGLGVHRAARIMAAGAGGQVLLSRATASVLEDEESPGVHLRDLGVHRLKDIDRPEHLYQLDIDGLPVDFPPLRTADAPTPFSGREGELATATRALFAAGGRARNRRWLSLAIAAPLAAAAAVVILVGAVGDPGTGSRLSRIDRNAVGVIDAGTGRILREVPAGATPSHVAAGQGAVWVANADDHSVSRIDPLRGVVVQTIAVGSQPSGLVVGGGAVWVTNSLDGTVSRIDPKTNSVVQRLTVGNAPVGIAYGQGAVWVANTGDSTITRIAAASGRPAETLPIAATELAFGGGSLWASQTSAGRVARIDPASGAAVEAIPVGNGPTGIAFGNGAAWVTNSLDGTVSRIDALTGAVTATIPTGDGPAAVVVGERDVWVANQFGGTVTRIDPRTGQIRRIRVGNQPHGLAIWARSLLVSVQQSGEGHRGGTLTFRMNRSPDRIDTALAFDTTSWSILHMTNDGLVAFDQVGGPQGTQLVPDIAVSLPRPTDGGRTYTFRLRPNIRYSNGRAVRAADVRATFERDFRLGFPAPYYYDGIVGAARCERVPERCDLSQGIVTDDVAGTVSFRLTAPDPEFPAKLALPFAAVLPAGTQTRPARTRALPATGPYLIARYRPGRQLTLVRNRFFHEWSRAAQPDGYPDRIVFRIGGTPDEAVDEVVSGRADAFSSAQSETPPSPSRLASLQTRHPSLLHTNAQPATVALFLNTRLPPFDRLDARRALNYAVDRAAAVDAVGGPDLAAVTCQILPPAYPGYRPYCPYTSGSAGGTWTAPDLARARALVARSGTHGMKVTVWSWSDLGGLGPYTVKLLRSLGYRATLRSRCCTGYFKVVGDSRTRAQIGTIQWISDYPSASGFFNGVLTCASFLPKDPGNANDAQFCDRRIDREIERALAEQAANPEGARNAWERIDREAVAQAPWVPLANPKVIDVVSSRVGNYQYSPAGTGMLIDQLWVR
jgi:YVTN family beta-propeller protein